MANKNARPPIGTKMYDVWENYFYVEGQTAPLLEYVVVEGTVTGYFEGRRIEMHLRTDNAPDGNSPRGRIVPYSYLLSSIGSKVFYTPKEAAERARMLTDKYERTWAWTGDPPLRRSWEKYLKEVSK